MTTAEELEPERDELTEKLGTWASEAIIRQAEVRDLKVELETARELVVQGKNEIDTAIAALETDSCWCSSKHRCYRCRALDTLRPTLERMHTFLERSK